MQRFLITVTVQDIKTKKMLYHRATDGAVSYLFDLTKPLNIFLAKLQEAFDAAPDPGD